MVPVKSGFSATGNLNDAPTASINLRVYDAANTSSKLKIPPHARTRPYEPPYEPNTRRVYYRRA